ncbi:MAG TPA: hypothetical protein VJL80_07610 [Aeromicrobium sp.]|nr:hypothetical protein [Aeromicrobium sp.]HKY57885.1 hypothetical protein [Aeromicrobium sp.]
MSDFVADDWIDDLIADVRQAAKRHGVSFEYFMTRLLDEYLWPIDDGGAPK